MKGRILRDLEADPGFLEEDDRGTIWGVVDPSEDLRLRARNNSRLDALAVFLGGLREHPEVVLRVADRVIARARGLWTAGPSTCVRARSPTTGSRRPTCRPKRCCSCGWWSRRPPSTSPSRWYATEREEGVTLGSTKIEQVKKQLPAAPPRHALFQPRGWHSPQKVTADLQVRASGFAELSYPRYRSGVGKQNSPPGDATRSNTGSSGRLPGPSGSDHDRRQRRDPRHLHTTRPPAPAPAERPADARVDNPPVAVGRRPRRPPRRRPAWGDVGHIPSKPTPAFVRHSPAAGGGGAATARLSAAGR